MSGTNVPGSLPVSFTFSGILKLVRWPNLLMMVISQYLAAIFLIGPVSQYLNILRDLDLAFICLGTISVAAAGYIINDYYDVKIDYINKPDRVVVGKLLKRRSAMFIHLGLNALGIVAGALVSLKIAIIDFVAAIWLWGYSNQLKRMPLVGNLSVAILSGMSIAIVEIHYQSGNSLVYIYALFAFFISLIREILKDIEDLKGDQTFGCKTLPVIWGTRNTKYMLLLVIALFLLCLLQILKGIESHNIYLYFMAMIIPAIFFIYKLWIADTKRQFGQLSSFLKLLMLSGILSMTLV
jgi:4-hydroxybenzoate polyprenyltransferase